MDATRDIVCSFGQIIEMQPKRRGRFTLGALLSTLLLMFSRDYTVTKRQLGIACVVIGIVGTVGVLAIDILQVGRQGGIGPAQAFALFVMVVVSTIGLTLIPLGDAPA